MFPMLSRRELLRRFGVATVGTPLLGAMASLEHESVVGAGTIRFGYAAITWGGNDDQAIADISALGFPGIQLRSNVVTKYAERVSALSELLRSRSLTFVALSSGNLSVDSAVGSEQFQQHLRHAEFLRDAGGLYLQIIDERPRARQATDADYKRLGQLLTELGKRTADVGIPISYHHHMGSLGEGPQAVRAIMEAADPRFVKFQLDTAHYRQGGGDPVQAIRDYADRLLFLHIKDVESPVPGDPDQGRSYRFVELGRGKVDLKGVFAALRDVNFSGWAVVELDAVPNGSGTPKDSAIISKTYLKTLGFDV